MRIAFAPAPRRRRPSLTPMIDVVFLLLVFFMLAARFGGDVAISLGGGGGGSAEAWPGGPRLVSFGPGELALNGRPVTLEGLPAALAPLLPAPGLPVILLPEGGADLQRLLDVMEAVHRGTTARPVLGVPTP